MTTEELKIRQLANQHLLTPTDKLTVLHDLCGVQAQFMANAIHSLKIRSDNGQADTFKDGLVKNWTVRGTVHVFAEDDLPLFMHCNNGQDYLRNDWRGKSFWNQRAAWALTPERQAYFVDVILEALQGTELTREELKTICRKKGMTEPEENSMFDPWGGGIREICERGFLNYVVQEKKAFCLAPAFTPIPEQEAKLQEIIRKYKGVPGGTMPVMQQAQEIFGYLPEEVQIQIAEGLDIPLEEVYGISTFYSLYDLNPKGQYKITVCLGTACYVKGSQAVLDKIVARLGCPVGSISPDGKYSVDANRCVGACGLAPVMMVNDDVYGRMTPEQVDDVLAKYK